MGASLEESRAPRLPSGEEKGFGRDKTPKRKQEAGKSSWGGGKKAGIDNPLGGGNPICNPVHGQKKKMRRQERGKGTVLNYRRAHLQQ